MMSSTMSPAPVIRDAPTTRVLVVDDEPDIRELVSTVLRYEGFEVADGRERP